MVLDGATNADDGVNDPPPGDMGFSPDEQQDGKAVGEEWHIDISKLPRPLGVFGVTSWDTPARIELLRNQLASSRAILERPLRQEEVDALTWKFANSIAVTSYLLPTGFIAGTLWAFSGREKYFQLLKDNAWNPDKFLTLKNHPARVAWLGLKLTTCTTVSLVVSGLIWSSIARTQDIAHTIKDPRLKDYREALNVRAKDHLRGAPMSVPGQKESIASQGGRMDHTAEQAHRRLQETRMKSQEQPQGPGGMANQYSVAWQRARNAPANPTTRSDDDMSPTGGAFQDDFLGEEQDYGLMSDAQLQANEKRQQKVSRATEQRPQWSPQSQRRVAGAPDTDGQGWQEASQQQQGGDAGVQTGGVWERLRREAAAKGGDVKQQGLVPGSQQRSQQGPRRSTTGDESFAYSQTDAERQYARSEAQKEFDARVEKERHGGDFDQPRNRRW